MTPPSEQPEQTRSTAPGTEGTAPPDRPTADLPAAARADTVPDSARPTADASGPLPVLPGYEVLGRLGEGGMAEVYLARHAVMRRTVALKVLRARGATAAEPRFRAEAEALARLDHPSVVRVFDVGESGGQLYLAMEYVPGGRLADQLKAGLPAFADAARLVEALARAVHAAHAAGIIHRDLKPQNVLIDADGRPKVADFGLAKLRDGSAGDLTRTLAVMGTPAYMAPEQAVGRTRAATEATDVYGLGAILYECLTGRPPFQGAGVEEILWKVAEVEPEPPRRVRPDVPPGLEAVCLRCLEKVPWWRYPSAEALADDLARFAAGEPVRGRVGWFRRLFGCKNRPVLRAVAATAFVLSGAAVAAVYFAGWRPAAPVAPPVSPPVVPAAPAGVAGPGPAVLPVAPAPRPLDDVVTAANQEERLAAALGLMVIGAEVVTDAGEMREVVQSLGTAFAVTPDGSFLTCRHMVADVVEAQARLDRGEAAAPKGFKSVRMRIWLVFGKEKYVADVRYLDPKHDLAVLKIDRRGPYFRLRADPAVPRGEKVSTVGFPQSTDTRPREPEGPRLEQQLAGVTRDYTLTTGIVSSATVRDGASILLHTATLRPGAGGSPLIADDGTAAGINVGMFLLGKDLPSQPFALTLPQFRAAIDAHAPGARWR